MIRFALLVVSLSVIGVVAVFSACQASDPAGVPQSPASEDAAQPSVEQQASSPPSSEQQTATQPDPEEPERQSAQTQAEEEDTAEEQVPQQEDAEQEDEIVLGGDRPARLLLPEAADRSEPRPLIVLLHGYSSRASEADAYFQFSQWVDEGEFGLLLPNGTVDRINNHFWNATAECCDIFGTEVDDVGYIKSLIEEAREVATFDAIMAVGHSNGGFMAYRLACEAVPGLVAVVSLAGGAFVDPEECRSPMPISVLQIHGTDDSEVLYAGGRLPSHPDPERRAVAGAKKIVLRWAERAGCDIDAFEKLSQIDTDTAVEGAETSRIRYSKGCADGVRVDLWTIEGGGHVPLVRETDFTPGILEWLAQVYGFDVQLLAPSDEQMGVDTIEIGGERPARLLAPSERGEQPIPLVLSLHGYTVRAQFHDWYFGLSERIVQYNFALITPRGTVDNQGNPFWNATAYCCDLFGSGVDDAAWLAGLVAEAREAVNISGVYVVGYSNGGFMSYRLACDGLDGLVAIASLAGSSHGDPADCEAAPAISVLQIHGSEDQIIPYDGYRNPAGLEVSLPGALEVTARWAERAGCDSGPPDSLPNIDLDQGIVGAETTVQRVHEGCADGITVELWTIEGAGHGPDFQADWPDRLLVWLFIESRMN